MDESRQLGKLIGTLVYSDDHQYCKVTSKEGKIFECNFSDYYSPSQDMWVFWIYVNRADTSRLLSQLGMNQSDTEQFRDSTLSLHHESWDGVHHVIESVLESPLNPADTSQAYSFLVR